MAVKSLDDDLLLRYSAQIMLPYFDIDGQKALNKATVLIIGLGGTGSAAALYLAASGAGHLLLADHDTVSLSNLQRQIIHKEASLNTNKAVSAEQTLSALNSQCCITALPEKISEEVITQTVAQADVVLDCTDNFATHLLIGKSCFKQKKPLVSGNAIRAEGMISVFDARQPDSPCYRCLYPKTPADEDSCVETGVVAPIVGLIGSLQAMEAIKLIAGFGAPLVGRLLAIDVYQPGWRSFRLPRRPSCPDCGQSTQS